MPPPEGNGLIEEGRPLNQNPGAGSAGSHGESGLIPPPAPSPEAWRYDHAWRVLNLNQEIIRATDQKIYMLIVMSTLLVSFSANNLDRLSREGWLHDAALPILGLTAIAFFVFALATLLARHDPIAATARPSLVFFGHILGRTDLSCYRSDFHAASQYEVIDDMLAQILIVSSILRTKLATYRRAWICLAFQVAIFLALCVFGHLF
jgi:hypothetical protein